MSATSRLWFGYLKSGVSVVCWPFRAIKLIYDYITEDECLSYMAVMLLLLISVASLLIGFNHYNNAPVSVEVLESNMSNSCYRSGAVKYLKHNYVMTREAHNELLEVCDSNKLAHQAIFEKYR